MVQSLAVSFVLGLLLGFFIGVSFGARALKFVVKHLQRIFGKRDNTEQLNRIEKELQTLKNSKDPSDDLPTTRW